MTPSIVALIASVFIAFALTSRPILLCLPLLVQWACRTECYLSRTVGNGEAGILFLLYARPTNVWFYVVPEMPPSGIYAYPEVGNSSSTKMSG